MFVLREVQSRTQLLGQITATLRRHDEEVVNGDEPLGRRIIFRALFGAGDAFCIALLDRGSGRVFEDEALVVGVVPPLPAQHVEVHRPTVELAVERDVERLEALLPVKDDAQPPTFGVVAICD